jgi:hypothetical protein
VAHQVHSARRHGRRERVQRPAQTGIEGREDRGDGEHRRRVSGWKRVDVERGVRPRSADQVLERVLDEAGDHERDRAEPGRLVQRRAPPDTSHEPDAGADDEQRDAAPDGIEGADHAIEHQVLPGRRGGGHATIERDSGRDHQEDDANDREAPRHERTAALRQRRHQLQFIPRAASAVSATQPTTRRAASTP